MRSGDVDEGRLYDELRATLRAARDGSLFARPEFGEVPLALRVVRDITFAGDGGSPRDARRSRSRCERTRSRGLSIRTVAAPTRIASQDARTASTRSKSSPLESSSRDAAPAM